MNDIILIMRLMTYTMCNNTPDIIGAIAQAIRDGIVFATTDVIFFMWYYILGPALIILNIRLIIFYVRYTYAQYKEKNWRQMFLGFGCILSILTLVCMTIADYYITLSSII